jgi:hypothetical protein
MNTINSEYYTYCDSTTGSYYYLNPYTGDSYYITNPMITGSPVMRYSSYKNKWYAMEDILKEEKEDLDCFDYIEFNKNVKFTGLNENTIK